MCTTVFVGKQHCKTLGELRFALGGEPVIPHWGEMSFEPTCCLCVVDIEKTAAAFGYTWRPDPEYPPDILFER